MPLRPAGCLAVLAVVCGLLLAAGGAECADLRQTVFNRIVAKVPKEIAAGVEFPVSITFVDSQGNPMADGWKPESSLTLQTSQPTSIQPPVLTPGNYVPGFTYRVRTEKAGEMTLFLRDDHGWVLHQWSLTIKPGRPVKLLVDIPSRVEAGETITMVLQALDEYGNIVSGYEPGTDTLEVKGGGVSIMGEGRSRSGDVFEIPVKFREFGSHSISVRDRNKGIEGSAASMAITSATSDHFDTTTTDKPAAAKRVQRPGVLDAIYIVEDGKKALVTFSTNGVTEYSVVTSAKRSRKWINIEFPSLKIDLPGRVVGGEKIVGGVSVESTEGGQPGVKVSVEVLPAGVSYDVYRKGQGVVLEVSER